MQDLFQQPERKPPNRDMNHWRALRLQEQSPKISAVGIFFLSLACHCEHGETADGLAAGSICGACVKQDW